MSPLPEKRKSAEEIAELRKSLGIGPDGPPPDAPGMAAMPVPGPVAVSAKVVVPEKREVPAQKPAEKEEVPAVETVPVSEEPAARLGDPDHDEPAARLGDVGPDEPAVVVQPEAPPEGRAAVSKAPHSLRKSAGLAVDKPKEAVSRDNGQLPAHRHDPDEVMPAWKPEGAPSDKPNGTGGTIPARRHSEKELQQLRHGVGSQVEPPVVQLDKLAAHPAVLVVLYGAGFVCCGLGWAGDRASKAARIDLPFDWLVEAVDRPWYAMALYGIVMAGVAAMLLGAGWIQWRKKRSRHHAAILTILAVLVLVFGTLYFFPQLHGA